MAPDLQRDEAVYKDDCVEMFILPEFRTGTYWEIVVGPGGSVFDAIHCKKPAGWGMLARVYEDLKGMRIGCRIEGTLNRPGDEDTGYTVEIAVPADELPEYSRTRLAAGHRLHFMLVRLDRNGEEFKTYAYQPLLSWGHNIWNHAVMELVR